MDDNELHYINCNPEKIWENMMLEYVNTGGDILYPGDEKEMLLRTVQACIVQALMAADNALRMMSLRYAIEGFEDIIGQNRFCERIQASAARATVTIKTNAIGKSQTLSAGTAMTSDGEMFYLLVEDLTLTGYEQTLTVEVVADRTGSAGNGLLAGTEMTLAVTNGWINSIVVATNAQGGNEEEEDEVYRERIRAHGLASVSTGPSQQYESVAENVSSAIVDAKALRTNAGEVTIFLIFSTETGQDAIIQAVLDAASPRNIRPLTDRVHVMRATDIPYTLNVQYTCDNSSFTAEAIANAVKDYQDWQDNTIGRPFNPDRLMAAIYQAGATRVLWGEGSKFGEKGEIAYTEIKESEHCKGAITLSATAP